MKIIHVIFVSLCLNSCYESNEAHRKKYLENYEKNVPHYRAYRKEMLAFSKKQVGEAEYNKVYQQFLDTIDTWAELGNRTYTKDTNHIRYKLDELICFNDTKDKLVGAKLHANVGGTNLGGGVEYLSGAKINGNWYFFGGAYQVVSKTMNSDLKKGKPISFYQLENYCVQQVLGGYMKNGRVNHKWFDGLFKNIGWGVYENRYDIKQFLNGFKIDDKKTFYEFKYIRLALNLRIMKSVNDSIHRYLKLNPPTSEYIRLHIDSIPQDMTFGVRNFFNRKYIFAVGKYPDQNVWKKE